MSQFRSIPTNWDGVQFRSMLEARWAAFMYMIGWEVTYEPFEGDGYIPDFLGHAPDPTQIRGRGKPFFVEVKPAVTYAEYCEPQEKLERGLLEHGKDVLIVGAHPLRAPSVDADFGFPAAGRLGEYHPQMTDALGEVHPASFSWSEGAWIECRKCHGVSVFHTLMSFEGRPCGHYDGDGHLGEPPVAAMERLWKIAGNTTRYRHKGQR